MATIDELLAAIAAKGNFNHLSLAFTWEGKFRAFFRDVKTGQYVSGESSDPAKAVRLALTKKPDARPAADDDEDEMNFG